jgi:hypothetical protein
VRQEAAGLISPPQSRRVRQEAAGQSKKEKSGQSANLLGSQRNQEKIFAKPKRFLLIFPQFVNIPHV